MKIALKLLLLTLLLMGCARPEPKSGTTRNLAGTWVCVLDVPDHPHAETTTVVGADGHYSTHAKVTISNLSNRVWTADLEGTLEIKDGILVDTVTKDSQHTSLPRTLRAHVVRMNDNELVVKCEGSENESILRKQE
jgi:uncharacterized lipoprotein NlpE involved in copper resistance